MKYYFLIIVTAVTLFQSCSGPSHKTGLHTENYIDSIENSTQITDLIVKIDDSYEGVQFSENLKYNDQKCQKLADSLNVKPWTKADFDNNGFTDLLVIGSGADHPLLCVLDKEGSYEIIPLRHNAFQKCEFPVVENNKIKYYFEGDPKDGKENEPERLEQVTLVYNSGDFVEENANPTKKDIEKIEFSTSGCFGTCPIFDLTIHSDRSAEWFAKRFNKIDNREVKGDFNSTITKNKFEEIINLLNYIDFVNLKDDYSVGWTDDQTATLKVTYNNGKIKTIKDYGLKGTRGLEKLYQLLYKIRENQEWVKKGGEIEIVK